MFARTFLDMPKNITESIIAQLVDIKDLVNLNRVSRKTHSLFKKPLYDLYDASRVLFSAVMKADPAAVEGCIEQLRKNHPSHYWVAIIYAVNGIETHNGRAWSGMHPLGFAMWAGDIKMVEKLLSFMPDEYLPLYFLLKAMRNIQIQGTQHGGILSAFHKLIMSYVEHQRPDYHVDDQENMKDGVSRQNLGLAQMNLPVYGLQELCRPMDWGPILFSLSPSLDFDNQPELPRLCRLNDGANLLERRNLQRLNNHSFISHSSGNQIAFATQVDRLVCVYGRRYFENLAAHNFKQINTLIENLVKRVHELDPNNVSDAEPANKVARF